MSVSSNCHSHFLPQLLWGWLSGGGNGGGGGVCVYVWFACVCVWWGGYWGAAPPQQTDICPDHDLGLAGQGATAKPLSQAPGRHDLTQPLRAVEASLTANQLISKPSTHTGIWEGAAYLNCIAPAFLFTAFVLGFLTKSTQKKKSFTLQIRDVSSANQLILRGSDYGVLLSWQSLQTETWGRIQNEQITAFSPTDSHCVHHFSVLPTKVFTWATCSRKNAQKHSTLVGLVTWLQQSWQPAPSYKFHFSDFEKTETLEGSQGLSVLYILLYIWQLPPSECDL